MVITREKVNQFVLIFLFGSFFGWIIELFYRSIINHQIVNPGFLSGPFLPIYGFGLIFLSVIAKHKEIHWLLRVFIFAILATLMELIAGWFFEYFFHLRLWDYSKEWGNVGGWICPRFFLYWLVCSFVYYFFLQKIVDKKINHDLKSKKRLIFSYILVLIIFFDISHSFYEAGKVGESLVVRKYKKIAPVLIDYKSFTTDKVADFGSSLFQAIKNYSNYKLPEKILKRNIINK